MKAITKLPIGKTAGERIRKRRLQLGLDSQRKLSVKADIASSAISLYETGARALGLVNARRLAEALDVSLGWLLEGEGDE